LPREVKIGDLEGVLEKMLYKFLGEGLVSVAAKLLPLLLVDSRGIVRPPATVAVAGLVKAGSTIPATSVYNFLEVEGSTSVPRELPMATVAVTGVVKVGASVTAAISATSVKDGVPKTGPGELLGLVGEDAKGGSKLSGCIIVAVGVEWTVW